MQRQASQRKIDERAAREVAILDFAEQEIREQGYLGFKMDTVAKAIGTAKGTSTNILYRKKTSSWR